MKKLTLLGVLLASLFFSYSQGKISAMDSTNTVATGAYVPIVQGNPLHNYRATVQQIVGSAAWLTGGNAGIDPNTQYAGTSDNQDFHLRANAVDRLVFTTDSITAFPLDLNTSTIFFGADETNFVGIGNTSGDGSSWFHARVKTFFTTSINGLLNENVVKQSGGDTITYTIKADTGFGGIGIVRQNFHTAGPQYGDSLIGLSVTKDEVGDNNGCLLFSVYDSTGHGLSKFDYNEKMRIGVNQHANFVYSSVHQHTSYLYTNRCFSCSIDSGHNGIFVTEDTVYIGYNIVNLQSSPSWMKIYKNGVYLNTSITIDDGTQGTGKVLQSNVSGLASWGVTAFTQSDSATIYATTPAAGTTYLCTDCSGSGVTERIVCYYGAAWRRIPVSTLIN